MRTGKIGCKSNHTIYSSLIPNPTNMVSDWSKTTGKNPRQGGYFDGLTWSLPFKYETIEVSWFEFLIVGSNTIINQSPIMFSFKKSLHISGIFYLTFLASGNQRKMKFFICHWEQWTMFHSVETDRFSTASCQTWWPEARETQLSKPRCGIGRKITTHLMSSDHSSAWWRDTDSASPGNLTHVYKSSSGKGESLTYLSIL